MTLYKIQPSTNVHKASLAFGEELNGKNYFFEGRKQDDWHSITLIWNEHYQKLETLEKQDFTLIIGAGVNIVLNEKAKNTIEAVFKDDVEYLPIKVKGDVNQYYLLNVIHIVENALAFDKSEFRLRRNGEIGAVKKAVFNESNIPENRIFIAPQKSTTALFKGELLKDVCKEYGLTGLEFEEALTASS